MKKLISTIGLSLISLNVFAAASDLTIVQAVKAYDKGNISGLSKIYQNYPSEMVINYLYSKAMLNKNNTTYAQTLVNLNYDGFIRNDLIHQLLSFYYNNENFNYYKKAFQQLPTAQSSINEKCGYDMANIATSGKAISSIPERWLVSNNIPQWCAELVSTKYKQGKITGDARDFMLYNLLINSKSSIFNQIAPYIITKSNMSKYNTVSQIAAVAKKDPASAYAMMKQISLDSNAKTFLGTYLAMQFAIKQQFSQAQNLFDKYDDNMYLSDDEYEWQARTYLYFKSWKDLIECINNMPDTLKNKNVWLYWKAKAYQARGDSTSANKIFEQIPEDYSYYGMLAQAELGGNTIFKTNPPHATSFGADQIARNARQALKLYSIGKSNGLKNLTSVATAEWNYAVRQANDGQLLAMSNSAANDKHYDLSIYAANQMANIYMPLSFPILFQNYYAQYSKPFGLDKSYPMAISRQESRFNYNVVAWDGGIGLMQLMPQTAHYISRKTGYHDCVRQSPECNIKFGTWYLANLYTKFNTNLIYTTGAYNAGPNRSRKWQDALGKLDNKIQIELIPISITRDYVQKVLVNKAVYDAELAGSDQVNLLNYINKLDQNHYLQEPDDDDTDAQKLNN